MTDKRAVIDPEKCDKCNVLPICPPKDACPAQAIEREEDDDPYYVNAYCQGCGRCVVFCPQKAILMV